MHGRRYGINLHQNDQRLAIEGTVSPGVNAILNLICRITSVPNNPIMLQTPLTLLMPISLICLCHIPLLPSASQLE